MRFKTFWNNLAFDDVKVIQFCFVIYIKCVALQYVASLRGIGTCCTQRRAIPVSIGTFAGFAPCACHRQEGTLMKLYSSSLCQILFDTFPLDDIESVFPWLEMVDIFRDRI